MREEIAYRIYADTADNDLVSKAWGEAQQIILDSHASRHDLGLELAIGRNSSWLTVEDSDKMTKTLGKAIYPKFGEKEYRIRLQRGLIDKKYYTDLLSVLLHEMIHAYFPQDGHTGNFKKAACLINRIRPDMNVQRLYNPEEHLYQAAKRPVKTKYTVKCPQCGATWNYQRRGKVVQHPELYRCTKCQSALELVKPEAI